jgi:hypothetical protein
MKIKHTVIILVLTILSVLSTVLSVNNARAAYRVKRILSVIGKADGPTSILIAGATRNYYLLYAGTLILILTTLILFFIFRKKEKNTKLNQDSNAFNQKNDMSEGRGYIVKENGPVYYTKDMDKTARWFHEVLGWNSEIDERNAEGIGQYGCVYSIPTAIEKTQSTPFTGIHLFYGEPQNGMVAFMQVQGIEALHNFTTMRGWDKITAVTVEPWGAKTCTITTPDGCILKFFEA